MYVSLRFGRTSLAKEIARARADLSFFAPRSSSAPTEVSSVPSSVLPSSTFPRLPSLVNTFLGLPHSSTPSLRDLETDATFPAFLCVLLRSGMHNITDRAVVVKGQIVVRPIMTVALTYDHRLLDGREAVQFLGEHRLPSLLLPLSLPRRPIIHIYHFSLRADSLTHFLVGLCAFSVKIKQYIEDPRKMLLRPL